MKYKHILVALDLNEDSESSTLVINKAVSLAKNLDAKLSFINVDITHLDNDLIDYDRFEKRLVDEKYQELLVKLEALCEPIDYPITNKLVLGGEVEVKLIDEVKKLNVDLLISGHHHGFWSQWWSAAHKLLDITTVDLLLVRI